MLNYLLPRAAKLYPDKTAIACGDYRCDYKNLHARVLRLAGALRQRGMKRGDRIAVFMDNCHRYFEIYYASVLVGTVLVPMSTIRFREEALSILGNTGPRLLFVSEERLPSLPSHGPISSYMDENHVGTIDTGEYESMLEHAHDFDPDSEEKGVEDDPALILHTSGTTGEPKGAVITFRAILNITYQSVMNNRYTCDDIFLQLVPMFHLSGLAFVFTNPMVGGTDVLLRKFDPLEILRLIEKERGTSTVLSPFMIEILVNHPEINDFDLSSLRLLASGGAALSKELVEKIRSVLQCDITQGYGMTESACMITCLPPEDHVPSASGKDRLASCGREVVGVEVRVIHEDGREVKPGEVGEIIVRGPGIMKGYWNNPEATAEVLRDGWLYTGDMARVDEENYLFILDRKNNLIKSDGKIIYSIAVEKVLLRHPAICEVAVVGAPSETRGEIVKAVVVRAKESTLNEEAVIAFCRESLDEYQCPESVDFVESLPKGGLNKVLKGRIRDRYWGRNKGE